MVSPKDIEKKFRLSQDRLVTQSSDLSLESIRAMVDRKAIDVTPEFQRRERWDKKKRSQLMESFLLNVPVPPVYLAEDDFGTYSVIDGKQRITAIKAFMDDEFRLVGLEEFIEIEGMKFSELPHSLKSALEVRPYLRVVTLLKQSDPELKYEVFTRLNRGGEPLNQQEIRNVIFRGPTNDLLHKLSANDFLRRQLKIRSKDSPSYMKMEDVEFVLRFFTLEEKWQDFAGDLRKSMDDFMREHRDAKQSEIERLSKKFQTSISGCERIWGDHAFKRPVGDGWRHQMLAGMYDAQMISMAGLRPPQIDHLERHRDDIMDATVDLFSEKDFEESVRQATNTPSRTRLRILRTKQMIEHFLKRR